MKTATIRLKDPRWPDSNWNLHSSGMNLLLGLGLKEKLPAGGMAPRLIQGVYIFVAPLDPKRKAARQHRVRAICPICGKVLSAGRLHQHTH